MRNTHPEDGSGQACFHGRAHALKFTLGFTPLSVMSCALAGSSAPFRLVYSIKESGFFEQENARKTSGNFRFVLLQFLTVSFAKQTEQELFMPLRKD